jgi:hypothetical protein
MPRIRCEIIEQGSPRQVARLREKAQRGGWMHALEYWHRFVLPVHFTEEGGRRYHYQTRTRAYQKRKQKRYGHQNPLVWSGETRRMVQAERIITNVSARGATLRMRGPKQLYAYQKNFKQPYKAGELTTTVHDERRTLAKLVDRESARAMNLKMTTERRTLT